ncbi:hypothetical protein ACTOS9_12790 [Bacillus subtilis]|uniref:Uncharacterized protein n=1 Tax=Bacillus subtilis TaxID=1423 RepID=A0AAX3RJN8_BACIU|nr:hypothetical protein P5633_11835 [Bacillus subtilis]WGD61847.1 hypothetical protein P5648_13030 [Bacillus subtilis]WGD72272.1 hypothetical protein P5645_09395 [Bacillus subtilis]WGD74943.1 hypothetical protein P5631_13360 [Bacillus subtilis]
MDTNIVQADIDKIKEWKRKMLAGKIQKLKGKQDVIHYENIKNKLIRNIAQIEFEEFEFSLTPNQRHLQTNRIEEARLKLIKHYENKPIKTYELIEKYEKELNSL